MNKFKGLLSFILVVFMLFSGSLAFSQEPLHGSVVVVPAGRSIDTVAENGISSSISRVGDPMSVVLQQGFYDNGSFVFPNGTIIEGKVTEVNPAGRTGKNGDIAVRFTTAISPSGKRLPISAIIETNDGTGIVRGGTTKGRIGKMFLRGLEGAAAGAILGTAMGGITKGSVGKGAAYGTAIGGGAGMISNIVKKGNEAEIQSGKHIELILMEPVRVTGNF